MHIFSVTMCRFAIHLEGQILYHIRSMNYDGQLNKIHEEASGRSMK